LREKQILRCAQNDKPKQTLCVRAKARTYQSAPTSKLQSRGS